MVILKVYPNISSRAGCCRCEILDLHLGGIQFEPRQRLLDIMFERFRDFLKSLKANAGMVGHLETG
jgi:hypothetical protein